MNLLNDGVCVKKCPTNKEAVECLPTKKMIELPKYKTVCKKAGDTDCPKVLQKEYFENCIYYMDSAKLAGLLGKDIAKLAKQVDIPAEPFRYGTIMTGIEGEAGFCMPSPDPKQVFISPEIKE